MQTETTFDLVQLAPPGQGGVFDYLQCLQTEWATRGVRSQVLNLSKALADERSLVDRIDRSVGEKPCSIVLHFSGYGYGRRGLCFWLLDELTALKAKRREKLRLVVIFHELFATGEPPWRSAFWLSGLQALIATRLARMADAVWTNTAQHAGWLRETVDTTTPVHVRPVFSNVGEPVCVPALAQREAQALVFGSPSTRQRAIDGLRGQVSALQGLGITSLIEVGGGGPSTSLPTALPCHHAGRLDPDALSLLLQRSRFGLLDYPPQFLGKSGVFAAYAAHGCVVLNTCKKGTDTDALAAGHDYLVLPDSVNVARDLAANEARTARLSNWYAGHRLSQQAHELLALAAARPR